MVALPLGALIFHNTFPGKSLLISFINTLFSLPTVLVGLLVFLFFSRTGPLGEMGLLFTPTIMIIGQALLVTPLMLGLVISAHSGIDRQARETAVTLGASGLQLGIYRLHSGFRPRYFRGRPGTDDRRQYQRLYTRADHGHLAGNWTR
jgi:tungstate transport system permease protein